MGYHLRISPYQWNCGFFLSNEVDELQQNDSENKVSDVLDIDRTSIFRWAKRLDNKGFDSLKNSAKHKDGIKLKIYHKENIKKWITNNPNITRQEVVQKLKDEFDLKISISTARRAMKSCGFSYITPRQNHYKQDKDDGVKFKKNSN